MLDTSKWIAEIKAEITRLQKAVEILEGSRPKRKARAPMSAAARAKISAVQRKRWAKLKAKKAS